jgi:hypothetical protein
MSVQSSASVVQGFLGAFVGVHDRRAGLGGEADGLFEILDADLGLGERRVSGEAAQLHAVLRAAALESQGIVEHRDAVEVAGFAEQLAAPVDHRLDVVVAELGGGGDAPFKVLVRVPDEFKVDAEMDVGHGRVMGEGWSAVFDARRLAA